MDSGQTVNRPMISFRLGFGCSALMGVGNRTARLDLLNEAWDHGVTHFDVARMYGLGFAENELGKFLRTKDGATVTTKFGIEPAFPAAELPARFLETRGLRKAASSVRRLGGESREAYSLKDASKSLDRSLKRLQLEVLDYFLMHEPGAHHLPADELFGWLQDAQQAGKIREFGLATDARIIEASQSAHKNFGRVVQYEESFAHPSGWSANDLAPGQIRITHRAIVSGLSFIDKALKADQGLSDRLRVECDLDVSDSKTIAHILLRAAARKNPGGLILFSTRSKSRIRENVESLTNVTIDNAFLDHFEAITGGGGFS